jgi:hypothetical protein
VAPPESEEPVFFRLTTGIFLKLDALAGSIRVDT